MIGPTRRTTAPGRRDLGDPRPSDHDRALRIIRVLRDRGHVAYLAGGCVRDLLLKRAPKDLDIVTDATPDRVLGLFPNTRSIGKAFAVIQVLEDGRPFEVATFRRDASYADGRRPEAVTFTQPEEDAKRRDFTINGMFMDPLNGEVLDFVGGREDLDRRLVRAIGDPEARFREDHLRMLRAVRFAATLEFDLEERTAAAIREHASAIQRISAERVQQELSRLLAEAPHAGQGLVLLDRVGLLSQILPEIAAMKGVEQPPEYHPEGDVFRHTVAMLDLMQDPEVELAYAVLLHDVGKPPTYRLGADRDGRPRIRFDNHAAVGADMAEAILRRLRMSNAFIDRVVTAVRQHMRFIEVRNMRDATLRRMLAAPTLPLELELHRLDCLSSHGDLGNYEFLQERISALAREVKLPEPWVSGRDLMALGIPEGPLVGQWRRRAYDAQLNGQFASREALLAWLGSELARDRQAPPGGAPAT